LLKIIEPILLLSNSKSKSILAITGKAEIDFILSKAEKIIPVEVKLSGEKFGKSFYSFLNAYEPEKAIIVSLDKFKKEKVGKTIVYWVPVFYF